MHRILAIDDDTRSLRLLTLSLQRAGYDVVTAVTGELGIRKFKEERPDLVLMDVMMPGIDGFETTRRIRQLPQGSETPIIFLSAGDEVEAKVKALRGGGSDYVTKPVKFGELLARLEVHLRTEATTAGRAIVVFGSKSGVGTTTVTINLALALQHLTMKTVTLIDWHRPLGDVAFLLDLPEDGSLDTVLPHEANLSLPALQQITCEFSPQVQIIPGAMERGTAPHMTAEALSNLLDLTLTEADYVLVDVGPFFSWSEPPLIKRENGLNLCVLTTDALSIWRAAQAMKEINTMKHRLWPILNQASATEGDADAIENQLGTGLQGQVPQDSDRLCSTTGSPPPLYLSDHPSFIRVMNGIASQLIETLSSL